MDAQWWHDGRSDARQSRASRRAGNHPARFPGSVRSKLINLRGFELGRYRVEDLMRGYLSCVALGLAAALAASAPAAAGDFNFIAGKYALDSGDCKLLEKGKPFSKELVGSLSQEVLTPEGITSPREVHCKFRSASEAGKGWTVKADCEEMGAAEAYELAVTPAADGALAVVSEDVYGPEPLVFKQCK
jgi:hypothetical protein